MFFYSVSFYVEIVPFVGPTSETKLDEMRLLKPFTILPKQQSQNNSNSSFVILLIMQALSSLINRFFL